MAAVPNSFRRLMVTKVSQKFRECVAVQTVNTPALKDSEVLVRTRYLGINASDINFSAGRYDPTVKPPFPCGFEGLGEVVKTGANVKSISPHQPVAYMKNGSFSEYVVLSEREAIPLPNMKKEYLSLLVSGLTAGISLEKVGEMKQGETVLVTAAAGGTGQFAVQLAKLAGCHVIGTCSSPQKAQLLTELGCDRVVNYNEEKLADVLKNEYKRGVDVVYESVGGAMFDTCVNALAQHGRLIVIGWISGYETDKGFNVSRTLGSLPQRLLPKSASVRGFFLFGYPKDIKPTASKLFTLYSKGDLKCIVDTGDSTEKGPFVGLDSVYDAVDFLYSKKSVGKIVVEMPAANSQSKL